MVRIAANRAAALGLLVLAGLLALYVGHLAFGLGGAGSESFFVDGVYNAILLGATAICLARGLVGQGERAAWLLLGTALALSTAGDLYYTIAFSDPAAIPFPSVADALYLAFFPPCYVALGLLFRSRVTSFAPSLWLDGIVAGLTVAAVASALVFQAVLDTTSGSPAAVATNLAYPLGDFLLLALVVGALGASGWRIGRTWGSVLAGLALYAVADSVYLYQASIGTYEEGTSAMSSPAEAASTAGTDAGGDRASATSTCSAPRSPQTAPALTAPSPRSYPAVTSKRSASSRASRTRSQ